MAEARACVPGALPPAAFKPSQPTPARGGTTSIPPSARPTAQPAGQWCSQRKCAQPARRRGAVEVGMGVAGCSGRHSGRSVVARRTAQHVMRRAQHASGDHTTASSRRYGSGGGGQGEQNVGGKREQRRRERRCAAYAACRECSAMVRGAGKPM